MKKYVVVSTKFLDDLSLHIESDKDWVPVVQCLNMAADLAETEPTKEEKAKADEIEEDFQDLVKQ